MTGVFTISARALGRKKPLIPDYGFPLPPDFPSEGEPVTLRDLITRVVTEEVRAFEQRQEQRKLVRILTEGEIEGGLARGRVDPGGRDLHQKVNAEDAVATALQAFDDGIYLEDGSARAAALKGRDAEQAFLALWTLAFDNAIAALQPARALLKHPEAEFRFVAARLLSMIDIPAARQILVSALEDEDLHVVCCALDPHEFGEMDEALANSDFFERLEKVLPRFPEKKTPPAICAAAFSVCC